MKKVINIMLTFMLVLSFLIIPEQVSAKTLRQLKNELALMQAEYNANKYEKNLTASQINEINKNIAAISTEVTNIGNSLITLNDEIEALTKDIADKTEQVKDIMNFVQVSKGETAYLEYAFGAQSFTDFIYRMSVSEQLAAYNSDLVDTYNNMIVENGKKIEALQVQTQELYAKQDSLEVQMKSLGNKLASLNEVNISIEEEIKLQTETIRLYEDMGCGLDEDISYCGRNKLPVGTAFFRPINAGRVNSEYGMRFHPTQGRYILHAGVDLGSSGGNVPIYAAADGMVIALSIKTSCGGNIVYIHHNINGKYYTTMYAHLRTINVSPKQVVTRNTVIGTMGGDAYTQQWDKCTTGLHLHFQIANGLYLKDYSSYTTFIVPFVRAYRYNQET